MGLRKRVIGFIAIIQFVLFLTHILLYKTWTFSPAGSDTRGAFWIKLSVGFLSVSFVAASLLAFRYTNAALRAFYRAAAIWLGLLSFLFAAAVCCWITFGVARLTGLFQRKLDANHANHGAACELTGGVAWAKSRADQRFAPRARAKWQFSAAHGGEDCEGRARRDFYCW